MNKDKKIQDEAKVPDVFLTFSEHLLKWIESHIRSVAIIFAIALLGGLAWLANNQWAHFSEKRAAKTIYKVEAELNQIKDRLEKADQERMQKDAKAKVAPTPPPAVDFEKTYAAPARQLEEAILAHKSTQAARASALNLAGLYLDNQKPSLADEFLKKMVGGSKADDALTALLSVQAAVVAMDVNDFKRAEEILKALISNPAAVFLRSEALLKLGVVQEKLGNADQAQATFTRIETEFAGTDAAKTAKGYLRLLKLRSAEKAPSNG
jgi:TolA-binding protein